MHVLSFSCSVDFMRTYLIEEAQAQGQVFLPFQKAVGPTSLKSFKRARNYDYNRTDNINHIHRFIYSIQAQAQAQLHKQQEARKATTTRSKRPTSQKRPQAMASRQQQAIAGSQGSSCDVRLLRLACHGLPLACLPAARLAIASDRR